MDNESNVNNTQNPNVTNVNVGNNNTEMSINTTSVVSVKVDSLEEDSVSISNVNMPNIVNPLDVKIEDLEPVTNVEQEKKIVIEQQQDKGPSEYALKLQKAIDDYKPPSKFQMFSSIFIIVLIFGFALFLPEISNYINYIMSGGNKKVSQEITSGVLVCVNETTTANLDKIYTRKFNFEDKKLKSAVIETTTRGDINLDEETLNELYNKCDLISKSVIGVSGITVKCEYSEGLLVERERFDYATYDLNLITTAYTEAGSNVLEFDYDADIDVIMKSMRQAGFTCEKESKQ